MHTCPFSTLSSFATSSSFVVTGASADATEAEEAKVGDLVTVNCALGLQYFTADDWDADDGDNTLTIICKPERWGLLVVVVICVVVVALAAAVDATTVLLLLLLP